MLSYCFKSNLFSDHNWYWPHNWDWGTLSTLKAGIIMASASNSPEKEEGTPSSQEAILNEYDKLLLSTIQLFSNGPWKDVQDPLERVEKFKQCHQIDWENYSKKHKERYKNLRNNFLKGRYSQRTQCTQKTSGSSQNAEAGSSQLECQTEDVFNETSELTKRRRVRVRKFNV